MAKNTKLSVIIPAYARHPLTVRHVKECLETTRTPDEIIVVNDGGDLSLREMLMKELSSYKNQSSTNCKVIYARIEQDILWNYNGACNLGFWISTGDIVIIEDTDHIPDKNVYAQTVHMFESQDCDRIAYNRKCVEVSELNKVLEEWQSTKKWGPNQMVAALRREAYIKLKGQDERFGGHYGYMCYDWKNRYNNILKIKTTKAPAYYYAILDGGEPKLKRGMSPENRKIYKENANRGHIQHPHGILNFTYTMEYL